jgi:DNA polymerase elongation subunit (family B)
VTYDRKGIIPGLLERWYAERRDMQAKKKEARDKKEEAFWDKRQLVKKINLNSLYGAILNPGCRFFDHRIGQSTTLTGRAIARHMDAHINECITGKYDHVGDAIIYGDTDSCYFSAWPVLRSEVESGRMEWSKETCIALYDSIAEQVNQSIPAYMEQAFHCPRGAGELIKAGRELVADRSLFITKKRYAVNIIDLSIGKVNAELRNRKGIIEESERQKRNDDLRFERVLKEQKIPSILSSLHALPDTKPKRTFLKINDKKGGKSKRKNNKKRKTRKNKK